MGLTPELRKAIDKRQGKNVIPGKKGYQKRPMEERFWEKVNKTDSCWLWTGSTYKRGNYVGASFWCNGRLDKPSRVSWLIHNGPIPKGIHVLHTCDVGFCVNPEHLYLGTPADNARDRQERGRWGGSFRTPKADIYLRRVMELSDKGLNGVEISKCLDGAIPPHTIRRWVKRARAALKDPGGV